MPYKDPQKKIAWELRHRSQRIARRRELREIELIHEAPKVPAPGSIEHPAAIVLWGSLGAGAVSFLRTEARYRYRMSHSSYSKGWKEKLALSGWLDFAFSLWEFYF